MEDPGWSGWDTSGDVHFRSFTDSDGEVRFYQWNNRTGYCTHSSHPRSTRMDNAAVKRYLAQLDPRTAPTDQPKRSGQKTADDNEPSTNQQPRSFELRPPIHTRNTKRTSSGGTKDEQDVESTTSKGLSERNMPRNRKLSDISGKNAETLEINTQGSVPLNARLPEGFVIQRREFFELGRVFRTLYATPDGQNNNNNNNSLHPYVTIYVTLRPVVVLQNKHGHCIVVPIFSYKGNGLLKKKLTDQERRHHAVIHMKGEEPWAHKDEGIKLEAFPVIAAKAQNLTRGSRIRFDMWHTVQYNTLVKNLGVVDKKHLDRLVDCFNETLYESQQPSTSKNH